MNTRRSIPQLNIRNGFLQVSGYAFFTSLLSSLTLLNWNKSRQKIADCFDFSLSQAVDSVITAGSKIEREGGTLVSYVFLYISEFNSQSVQVGVGGWWLRVESVAYQEVEGRSRRQRIFVLPA